MTSYPQRTTLPPDAPSFGERYQFIKKLGKGGMGAVYKANDSALEKTVAVKILLPGLSRESIVRFQQEAKAAAKLQHPNIVKVLDFGQTPTGDLYLIMDYVGSDSLEDSIEHSKRLPLERALPIFIQITAGLQHAHANGVLHRDVKPSNIMISEKDTDNVQLVDFGLAKLQSERDSQRLTSTGARVGSPLYMSPEQASGSEVDTRSDIYSMGCLMYKVLTGKPPLQGETYVETIMMQRDEVPPLMSDIECGCSFPDEVENLVARALRKDPNDRFQSASELKEALIALADEFLLDSPVEIEELPPEPVAPRVMEESMLRKADPLAKKKLIAAISVGAVGLLAAVLFLAHRFDESEAVHATIGSASAPEFFGDTTADELIDAHRHDDYGEGEEHALERKSRSKPEQMIRASTVQTTKWNLDEKLEKRGWGHHMAGWGDANAKQMLHQASLDPELQHIAKDRDMQVAVESGRMQQLWRDPRMKEFFSSPEMKVLGPRMQVLWKDPKLVPVWADPVVQEFIANPKLWTLWHTDRSSPQLARFNKSKNCEIAMQDPRFRELLRSPRFASLACNPQFQKLITDPINMKIMRAMDSYHEQMKREMADIMCPIPVDYSKPAAGG